MVQYIVSLYDIVIRILTLSKLHSFIVQQKTVGWSTSISLHEVVYDWCLAAIHRFNLTFIFKALLCAYMLMHQYHILLTDFMIKLAGKLEKLGFDVFVRVGPHVVCHSKITFISKMTNFPTHWPLPTFFKDKWRSFTLCFEKWFVISSASLQHRKIIKFSPTRCIYRFW